MLFSDFILFSLFFVFLLLLMTRRKQAPPLLLPPGKHKMLVDLLATCGHKINFL